MIARTKNVAANVAALSLMLLAAAGCVGCGGAESGDGTLELRADLRPGELAERDGVRVIVPEPGSGVFAEVIAADGSMHTLELETQLDGTVVEHLAGTAASSRSNPPACSDGAFNLASYHWSETLHWRFKASTTPASLNTAAVEDALVAGTTNITTSRNDCGLSDKVAATQHYDGTTATGPNIHDNGTCGSADGLSVVAFGALPNAALGVTCTWYSQGVALETDIRLNRGDHAWYTTKPVGCNNRFDLQGVMTHERGHSFGLAHVSEASHGALTMSEAIGPCDSSARTLGLGDVRGLREKY
jgi:hypothetical protein